MKTHDYCIKCKKSLWKRFNIHLWKKTSSKLWIEELSLKHRASVYKTVDEYITYMLKLNVSIPNLESKQGCVLSMVLLNIEPTILSSAVIEEKEVKSSWFSNLVTVFICIGRKI